MFLRYMCCNKMVLDVPDMESLAKSLNLNGWGRRISGRLIMQAH